MRPPPPALCSAEVAITATDWVLRSGAAPRPARGGGGAGSVAASWLSLAERASARVMLAWLSEERWTLTMAGVPCSPLALEPPPLAFSGPSSPPPPPPLFLLLPTLAEEVKALQALMSACGMSGVMPAALARRPAKPGPPHLLMCALPPQCCTNDSGPLESTSQARQRNTCVMSCPNCDALPPPFPFPFAAPPPERWGGAAAACRKSALKDRAPPERGPTPPPRTSTSESVPAFWPGAFGRLAISCASLHSDHRSFLGAIGRKVAKAVSRSNAASPGHRRSCAPRLWLAGVNPQP